MALPFKKKYQPLTLIFNRASINKMFWILRITFIGKYENIVFLDSNVVSKNRISTYFIKCHHLKENLRKAKLENSLENRLKHYSKYKLLIIDEIGYLPIGSEAAKIFFQINRFKV